MTSRDFSTEKDKKETKQEAGSKILLTQPLQIEGTRKVEREVEHYNLYMILSAWLLNKEAKTKANKVAYM